MDGAHAEDLFGKSSLDELPCADASPARPDFDPAAPVKWDMSNFQQNKRYIGRLERKMDALQRKGADVPHTTQEDTFDTESVDSDAEYQGLLGSRKRAESSHSNYSTFDDDFGLPLETADWSDDDSEQPEPVEPTTTDLPAYGITQRKFYSVKRGADGEESTQERKHTEKTKQKPGCLPCLTKTFCCLRLCCGQTFSVV
eukprot:TRINITY_DN21051_c0_g1_i1.p1 TRINITY_DN21051_c0_g1~~TRINITY_DN21051_c0_g1_i1.p1  ORF type:complete len:199 (-),score=12.33 TRINITY_DN21051_c0_g1_i1:58-654(-)